MAQTKSTIENGTDKDTLADSASRIAETAKEYVADHVADAQDAGKKALDAGRDSVTAAHQTFGDAVRRNPTTAILGAVGLGVLLGLALRKNP
ncbi:MAG: hypothetical protein AAFW87_01825 [Pseudomonadota bacterium]